VIAFDVNVAIYAHRPDSDEHEAYSRWLRARVEADEPFGVFEEVLGGFVRVVTNPRIWRRPSPLSVALEFCGELLARPNCVRLRPGPRHWELFERLCRAADARGKLVPDAWLAAQAIEHGCEWRSADADFARFPGLRWEHPLRGRG